jgi:hypothetical protein
VKRNRSRLPQDFMFQLTAEEAVILRSQIGTSSSGWRAKEWESRNMETNLIQPEQIEQAILLIRGQRVMLDRDLAARYGVETKNLNKAVRRNLDRFPVDFIFQLTADEAECLRFQFGTLMRGQHFKSLSLRSRRRDRTAGEQNTARDWRTALTLCSLPPS